MDASMMMSQRPSGGGGGGGGSSNNSSSKPSGGSSGGGSSTIGKYKGVMLCNRPHRGPAQASNTVNKSGGTGGAGRTVPFRAGGHNPIENDIGLTRKRPERHAAPRKKVESVTSKHKKWLANFTAEKLRLEAEMEEEEEAKKKRKDKFMKKERKLRGAILTNVKGGEGKESDPEEPQTSARSAGGRRDEELEELLQFTQDINEEDFDKQMEAMLQNEDDADWVNSVLEKGDLDDPVEFDPESDDNELVHPDTGAGGYDGDDAISRKEWRVRMVETVDPETGEPSDADDAISRRDYLIEQGEDVERLHAGDERNRAAPSGKTVGLSAEALREWKSGNGEGKTQDEDEEDDILSTASAVLAESRKIRSVHSARSVAAIAQQKKKRSSTTLPSIQEVKPPVVVTLDEKRLEYKKHVNQLPYMNRNPAV